jgi:hypothetical protein
MNQTLLEQYLHVTTTNRLWVRNEQRWRFLLESYMGGEEYQRGLYLTKYVNETSGEYAARLKSTPLENHCQSVISAYISFLFRKQPEREFGLLESDPALAEFLEDADLDGRSFDAFMKEVSIWTSVFGHAWILVVKPNVGAQTKGDELQMGVRPYVNLITPLLVTDWLWDRQPNGRYHLTYLKYIEDANDSTSTIKEWFPTEIITTVVDHENKTIIETLVEPNPLNEIPAVCAYNQKSPVRGIGISDISDIADAQKFIYNMTSEVEQSIRINGHPALVKTPGTEASAGAGAIIQMEDNLDPGLKPYILSAATDVNQIFTAIEHYSNIIDKIANTGSIRATESRRMSGVAQEQEFQLLNARLSSKADNLELTEESIWQWFAYYQGTNWNGKIEYPDSFAIRDTDSEVARLKIAKDTATDPRVLAIIDKHILKSLGEDDDILEMVEDPLQTEEPGVPPQDFNSASCPIATQDIGVNLANRQTAIDTANYGPLNPAQPNPVFWMTLADKWSVSEQQARQSTCGNCAAFNITAAVKGCIEQGLAAGGSTVDEWDTVAAGQLGYCEAFDFKCAADRTCDAWVVGGPITD